MSFKYSVIFVKVATCPTQSLVKELGQLFMHYRLGEIKSMHTCAPTEEAITKSLETYSNTNGDGLIYLFLDTTMDWTFVSKNYAQSEITQVFPDVGVSYERMIIPVNIQDLKWKDGLVARLEYMNKTYKASLGCKGFCAS